MKIKILKVTMLPRLDPGLTELVDFKFWIKVDKIKQISINLL